MEYYEELQKVQNELQTYEMTIQTGYEYLSELQKEMFDNPTDELNMKIFGVDIDLQNMIWGYVKVLIRYYKLKAKGKT